MSGEKAAVKDTFPPGAIDEIDEVSEIVFDPGDVVLLYTDGITEAFLDNTENQFGVDGLMNILQKNGDRRPDEISSEVMEAVKNYEIYDDTSILVIKKT